jgi:hypothetical protein
MTTIADKLNQIIQIKLQLEQVLASENVTTDGSFEDVVNKIQELEVGDALMLTDFIQGEVETFSSNVTTLRAYSLCGMKSTKIFLPEVTVVNMYSLTTCPNLDYVYVPKLETVSNYTFSNCTKLGATYDIEFPNVTSITEGGFDGCHSLGKNKISFPKLTTVDKYSFRDCYSLTSFDFTNFSKIPSYSFVGCSGLKKVWIPRSCTTIEIQRSSGSVSLYSAPFYECFNVVIYTDASSRLSGWDSYFNLISYETASDITYAPVKYNSTYENYLNA